MLIDMTMHIVNLINVHTKYTVNKKKGIISYNNFTVLCFFLMKTDKGFDKATFENQMSVMRGQVRLHI